jgi:hypothetical protein
MMEKEPTTSTTGTPAPLIMATSRAEMELEEIGQEQFTNYRMFQENYRRKILEFFADSRTWLRLKRIHDLDHPKVFKLVAFFVMRYTKNDVVLSTRLDERISRHYCIKDEYDNALKRYEKRFYDFEARCGKGDLVYKGLLNPPIEVFPPVTSGSSSSSSSGNSISSMMGTVPVRLPLAQLNALTWFIEFGFDAVFWSRVNDVIQKYEEFATDTRRRYTETHRRKNQQIRKEAESIVIQQKQQKECCEKAPPTPTTTAPTTTPMMPVPRRRKATKPPKPAPPTPRPLPPPERKLTKVDREKVNAIVRAKKNELREQKRADAVERKRKKAKAAKSDAAKCPILLDSHHDITTQY